MDRKYLLLVCFLAAFFIKGLICEDLDEISFDDGDEIDDDRPLDDLSDVNDMEDTPSALRSDVVAKENAVRSVVMSVMKNNEKVKRNMAEVLPILRVMTPPQKLALATLVKSQVLAPQDGHKMNMEMVSTMFTEDKKNLTSDLLLPISLDIANIFRKARHVQMDNESSILSPVKAALTNSTVDNPTNETKTDDEDIPEAQELRGGPHFVHHYMHPGQFRPPNHGGPYRRNIVERGPPKPRPFKTAKPQISSIKDNNCDQLINGICLESNDYPLDLILTAIRRNKAAMDHLFAEYHDIGNSSTSGDYGDSSNRRVEDDKGQMCPSMIKYVRPKKARATSGNWKFVVNTGEHTQTLRIEKCSKPLDTCSYLTDNFKSRCVQIFNYHRLLTWDKIHGLHMDIFKVPTCCSCQIEGYKASYPPEHYPVSSQSEIFPGEDLSSDINIDPNLILHKSQYDSPVYTDLDYSLPSSSSNQNYVRKSPGNRLEASNHDLSDPTGPATTSPRFRKSKPVQNLPSDDSSRLKKQNLSPVKTSYDGIAVNGKTKSGISHYLEAPRPQQTQRPNPNNAYKRGVSPPRQFPTTPGKRAPVNGPRRRPPMPPQNPPFDLEIDASDQQPVQTSYNIPTSSLSPPLLDYEIARSTEKPSEPIRNHHQNYQGNHQNSMSKRINYNYHPIIDFFEAENEPEAQKRVDTMDNRDDGWRPVAGPSMGSPIPNSRTRLI